jgi:hypothetical protein
MKLLTWRTLGWTKRSSAEIVLSDEHIGMTLPTSWVPRFTCCGSIRRSASICDGQPAVSMISPAIIDRRPRESSRLSFARLCPGEAPQLRRAEDAI